MGKLFLKRYQNNNRKNQKAYGKWYLRAKHLGTIDTRELASHITRHGSLYTYDVVEGVISKTSSCIAELVQEGYRVKLDGLGIFYLAVTSNGTEKPEDATEDKVVLKHLRFKPAQSNWCEMATHNMTRMANVTTTDPFSDATTTTTGGSSQGTENPGQGGSVVEDEP